MSDMQVIKDWIPTYKSLCGSTYPGLDQLVAYGTTDEPYYRVDDVACLFDIKPQKIISIIKSYDAGIEYDYVGDQLYLTTGGVIRLATTVDGDVAKYLRRVVYECVKTLRSKHTAIMNEILTQTQIKYKDEFDAFRRQIECMESQMEVIIHQKQGIEEELDEVKFCIGMKETETAELRNREKILMAHAISARAEDLRDSERMLLESLIKKYAKSVYVYKMDEDGELLHITDRPNSKDLLEELHMVDKREYDELISRLGIYRNASSSYYSIDIDEVKTIIDDIRKGNNDATLTALNECAAYLQGPNGGEFIERTLKR
jgi:hypothetical protein